MRGLDYKWIEALDAVVYQAVLNELLSICLSHNLPFRSVLNSSKSSWRNLC